MVSASRCVSSAGFPSTGGVRFPQIKPRCGRPCAGIAGDQRIHPRAAALVFARIPVGVERSEMRVGGRVANLVTSSPPDPRPACRSLGSPGFRECGRRSRTSPRPRDPEESTAAELLRRNRTERRAAFRPSSRYPRARASCRRTPPAPDSPRGNASRSWSRKSRRKFCARSPVCAMRSSRTRSEKSRKPSSLAFSLRSCKNLGHQARGCRASPEAARVL